MVVAVVVVRMTRLSDVGDDLLAGYGWLNLVQNGWMLLDQR